MSVPYRLLKRMGLLVVLAAGACAAPMGDVQQKPTGGGSVCVASAIGHRFDIKTIGIMVFGNDLQTAAIGSWGIDEMAARKVGALLGPAFTVRPISFPKGAIEAYEAPRRELFRNYGAEFAALLRAAAASAPKCDYYVAITRGTAQYSDTNQTLTGLGVLKRDTVIGPRFFAYAIVFVRLYDGNTFAMKRPPVDLGKALQQGLSAAGIRGPYRDLDKADWPATPQAAEQSAKLRETTRALVEQVLTEAVPGLF